MANESHTQPPHHSVCVPLTENPKSIVPNGWARAMAPVSSSTRCRWSWSERRPARTSSAVEVSSTRAPRRPARAPSRRASGRRRRGALRDRGPWDGAYATAGARVPAMSDRPDAWGPRRRGWRVERLTPSLERLPERHERFATLGDLPVDGLYGPWDWEARGRRRRGTGPRRPDGRRPPRRAAARRGRPLRRRRPGPRHRPAGRAAVHPRHPPDRLPQPPVDDAHVRRVRLGRGHERPVPAAARRGPDRPLDRVRHADALRLRHGRSRGRGRVRDVRRGRVQPRRHGAAARRAAAGQGLAPR